MSRGEVVRTLALVVSDPDGEATQAALRSGCDEELVVSAFVHGVPGSLGLALDGAGIELPPVLERSLERSKLVHLQTARALSAVAEAFEAAGIRWVVVKGPALASLWEHGTVTRSYDDLDLLIDARDLPSAASALESAGFVQRNRNWSGFVELGVAEVPFDNGAVVVDLHWNLVALSDQRRHLRFDTAAMLERSVRVELGGVVARSLDPLDMFAHTCTHAGLAGARRLRMLRDVHLTAAAVSPSRAAERLSESGVLRLAAGVLSRAVGVFGPPADGPGGQSAWAQASPLGCDRWIRFSQGADRVWELMPGRSRTAFPGAVVAAGRDDAAATLGALVGLLGAAARSRVGLPNLQSEGGKLDWNVQDPRDTQRGYEDYLRYVRTSTR